ncbi:MAG: hypothetical protein ACRD6N_09845, partial [Pyrinomonadaceae bacterium]
MTKHFKMPPAGRRNFTLLATKDVAKHFKMPPACPVEFHAASYKRRGETSQDATGLSGGVSRSLAPSFDSVA